MAARKEKADIRNTMIQIKNGDFRTPEIVAQAQEAAKAGFTWKLIVNSLNKDAKNGPEYEGGFAYINPRALMIPYYDSDTDTGYQRGFDGNKPSPNFVDQVANLLTAYDINEMDPVLVHYDPITGELEVVDGNHRTVGSIVNNINSIPVRLITNKTYEERCAIFAHQDDLVSRMSSMNKYIGGKKAKNGWATTIETILKKYGYTLRSKSAVDSTRNIQAFGALKDIAEESGYEGLDFVFKFLLDLWGPAEPKTFHQNWLKVGQVVYKGYKKDSKYRAIALNGFRLHGSAGQCECDATTEFGQIAKPGKNGEGYLTAMARKLCDEPIAPKKAK